MVTIQLESDTFAVLLSGLYCGSHGVDARVIPERLWLDLADKLTEYLDSWNYKKVSLEEFIDTRLFIYPIEGLSIEDKEYLMNNTVWWTYINGRVELIVSMDMTGVEFD